MRTFHLLSSRMLLTYSYSQPIHQKVYNSAKVHCVSRKSLRCKLFTLRLLFVQWIFHVLPRSRIDSFRTIIWDYIQYILLWTSLIANKWTQTLISIAFSQTYASYAQSRSRLHGITMHCILSFSCFRYNQSNACTRPLFYRFDETCTRLLKRSRISI